MPAQRKSALYQVLTNSSEVLSQTLSGMIAVMHLGIFSNSTTKQNKDRAEGQCTEQDKNRAEESVLELQMCLAILIIVGMFKPDAPSHHVTMMMMMMMNSRM